MKVYKGKQKHRKQKKRWYIPVVISAMVLILGIQLTSLYLKLSDYRQREANLMVQLENVQAIQQDLADYEAYTHTDEFILNTARSKLGMVRENEIIFKEN